MSSLISWAVYDNNSAPLPGLNPSILAYCTLDGTTRPVIPTAEPMPGASGTYGFEASDEDAEAGTAYLIDNGPNAYPRYISGVITTPDLPKSAWHLEDDNGSLWTGAPPSMGPYSSIEGIRTPPSILAPRPYLFGVIPSVDDAAIGVTFLANSPTGANPLVWQDTLVAVGAEPEPPIDGYVQHAILVGNVVELLSLGFTHIEVHQSIDQGNSYQEITSPYATAARLESSEAQTTFQMGGKLLKVKIDGGAAVSISFSSLITNWTALQVANRINEIVPGLATISGNIITLTSPTTGRASSVEITYSDATDLGWDAGDLSYGTLARIPLSIGTMLYQFIDVAGSSTDRYKWRFSANGENPISTFSAVFQGQMAPLLPSSSLTVALARFYGPDGQPKKTRVLIAVDSIPQNIDGAFIGAGPLLVVDSDDLGFFQATMIRGARVKVAIENSSFTREFVVPNANSFQLLDAMTAVPDPFTVQSVPPLLIRRSS